MSIINEFKQFIQKGNVAELAIAVVMGSAFQGIVQSFVNDLIMPIIALMGGFEQISDLKAGPFNYGKIIASTLNFLFVAIVAFSIIKVINKLNFNKEPKA